MLRIVQYEDNQLMLNNDHITLPDRLCTKQFSLIQRRKKCGFQSKVQAERTFYCIAYIQMPANKDSNTDPMIKEGLVKPLAKTFKSWWDRNIASWVLTSTSCVSYLP